MNITQMSKTQRGVYHNLYKSEYAISNGEIAFYFSSRFYLNKFIDEYKDNRELFRQRLSRAMKIENINTNLLADINFYKGIEKRGFRCVLILDEIDELKYGEIKTEKGDISWQKLLKFALVKMTEKNTLDWLEMQKQKLDEH